MRVRLRLICPDCHIGQAAMIVLNKQIPKEKVWECTSCVKSFPIVGLIARGFGVFDEIVEEEENEKSV